jgi:uncharacterized protein YdiU (UPF0061 family)
MSSPETSTVIASTPIEFAFANTYARLPERFYSRVNPTPVAAPQLIRVNAHLALQLNLDPEFLASPEGVEILAGNRIATGSEPLAEAYAGHQFGHFVPQLGDGRANLLGEVLSRDGARYDIHLKGSGPTPFSRRGDGRAALGPVLREYLVSEAMFALGVPTTRALAAVTTGQNVVRETVQPGAIFTRVAASHIRVGTFQYFAARGDNEAVGILANYAIARHYPDAARSPHPYRAFLEGVVVRQARLIAQWLHLGFVHGVMNTDNMAVSGETIDFGPCAFMEAFDPAQVFSSIDANGRYAYSNQPSAALWNLMRFAECLLPLLEQEAGSKEAAVASANDALAAFESQFEAANLAGMRRKLGLATEREGDGKLIDDLLARMAANRADFTLTFRSLSDAAAPPEANAAGAPSKLRLGGRAARDLFADPTAFDTWAVEWRARLALEAASPSEIAGGMRRANPTFIPRNHRVQAVIEAAVERADFAPFEELLDVVTHPYDDRPELERYTAPALPGECITQTFCGT